MHRKAIRTLISMTVLSGMLVACSGGASKPSVDNLQSPAVSGQLAEEGSAKVTVQFWHSLGGKTGEYLNHMIKRFNESHNNIEVAGTYQGSYGETASKLQQSIATGQLPDIIMLERSNIQMFEEWSTLEDLTPYMQKSNMTIGDFTPGLMGHSTFNNKLVSLPFNRSTPILHINKTMLNEKGLAVPKTWDELKQTANALVINENGEYNRYGLTMPFDSWYPLAMMGQARGKFFNDQGTALGFDGEGVKTFGFLKELQRTGALYYPPEKDSGTVANQLFTSGKAGMLFQSSASVSGFTSSVKFEYATAFLPMDQTYTAPTGGANIAIMAGSKHKEAAWEFIRWAATDPKGGLQFILDTGYLPFTPKMAESGQIKEIWAKNPNLKTAYDQLKYASDTNKHVAWPAVLKELNATIRAIMYNDKEIEPALHAFKKEAEMLLSK
ncbi:ABC transporter substrate-binding protein [Paenibacillus allorhizosphaerae]|uniref:ABC transporter substrate-binding protein n=1 Tax=Paenibacillus allorhizosphaerae TaxID=2849866 RepID=A0ABM8VDI5_9BACL|nr:ABC transporter substrate-binding protein [Paenibacillus allorhizosphaerae]CAG7627691.1 hypothetical protein PAECIP111802_01379 [Paenibacillus allorhizosphaerae]